VKYGRNPKSIFHRERFLRFKSIFRLDFDRDRNRFSKKIGDLYVVVGSKLEVDDFCVMISMTCASATLHFLFGSGCCPVALQLESRFFANFAFCSLI